MTAAQTAFEVEHATSGSSRWWVVAVLPEYPHRSLVIKCDTKRCAAALVEILTNRVLDESLTRLVIADKIRAAHRAGLGDKAPRHAIDGLLLVIARAGVGIAPPAWWPAFVREILDR
jgi:hypothetical protein